MRRILPSILWLLALLLPPAVSAQGDTPPPPLPTPTPHPLDLCFSEGLAECIPPIVRAYGAPGLLALILTGLFIYFILTPVGELLRERLTHWLRRLPPFRPRPLTAEEEDEREEAYLRVFEHAPHLSAPDPMARVAEYLERLDSGAEPLRPDEEARYVPLPGGLGFDLRPRLGLALPPRAGSPQAVFTEHKIFPDLAEAMLEVDPDTGQPYPAFALLGEPGAGKSTLLRKLAREAVRRRLEDRAAPLPLFVQLSDHKRGRPLDFLRRHWHRELDFDGLDRALADGRVWLFCDGLNEMDRRGYETRVAGWREFLRQHFRAGGNRALIACRVADYGEGLALPRLLIHPMDEKRIREFLERRAPARAEGLWKELERDRREGRGDLFALAQVPFWLVIMADVRGGLPRNRARLAEEFVARWLDWEAARSGGRALTLDGRTAFVEALTRLGYRGLARSQNYTFSRREALRQLRTPAGPAALPAEARLALAESCSLLHSDGGVRFHHQLLQEYFAARELARRFERGRRLHRLWRVPWRRWRFVRSRWDPLPDPPSTGWEEATVLAAGLLAPEQAERLTLAVLPHNPPLAARCLLESGAETPEKVKQAVTASLRAQIENPGVRLPARLAAGKAIGRLGDPRILAGEGAVAGEGGKQIRFIEPDWVDVPAGAFRMGSQRRDRLAAEDERPAHPVTLSRAYRIGRFPVTAAEYRCFVAAGGYDREDYWEGETARRWLRGELSFEESYALYEWRIMREQAERVLPQLAQWVREERWLPAQARAYREWLEMPEEGLRRQWQQYESEKRDQSGRARHAWLWDDPRYTAPNQPVIGVCWYEARAYAAWLTEMLRSARRLPEGWQARLPTEAEWEKAARSQIPNSKSQTSNLWPWGNRWHPGRANTLEGRVLVPSPVGAYPQGASPCGALDMAGNVWEWCADWYDPEEYSRRAGASVIDPHGPETGQARVVRGGSWLNDRDYARCAYRDGNTPDDFLNNLGFRLVLSHDFSSGQKRRPPTRRRPRPKTGAA